MKVVCSQVLHVLCALKSTEIRVESEVETELIVAEVNERRPVRRASGSHKTDVVTPAELYQTLIEHLNLLPVYDEVLSTPLQGWWHFLLYNAKDANFHPTPFSHNVIKPVTTHNRFITPSSLSI